MTFTIWITGPPSSGKSTVTRALLRELSGRGVKAQVLESDRLREVLTPKASYTEEDRSQFYKSMAYIGKLLVENGVNVIFDATAHREIYREFAKNLIPDLIIVLVTCSLEMRQKRDVKGLYRDAQAGKVKTLPGFQVRYEEPANPDLIVDTESLSASEAAQKILRVIETKHGPIRKLSESRLGAELPPESLEHLDS